MQAQHEVDFGQAKHLLKFFVDKGHNIGESTALHSIFCFRNAK